MSNNTACMTPILSCVPRSVKIVTILVTLATGNIGRRIVDHLIDLGANDIRSLTKDPAKAKLPNGVTAITGYLGDPESLPAAFEGRSGVGGGDGPECGVVPRSDRGCCAPSAAGQRPGCRADGHTGADGGPVGRRQRRAVRMI